MKIVNVMWALFFVAGIAGCGGGGNTSQESRVDLTIGPPEPALVRGIFTDSPVSGIEYRTESRSGMTDADGGFSYYPGETVTFSIGDVVLGSAPAAARMTPYNIAPNGWTRAYNVARLLQSLDTDGNLENGIQISSAVRSEVSGRPIDFGKSFDEFDDAATQDLFASLNSRHAFSDGTDRRLVSDMQAKYNMTRALSPGGNPFDGGWSLRYDYEYPLAESGMVISVGGSYNQSPSLIMEHVTEYANARVSGSTVTFNPVSGVTLNGTIASDGTITIPDRTVNCKDVNGALLRLQSRLVLRADNTLAGEWSVAIPLPAIGYCTEKRISGAFVPDPVFYTVIDLPNIVPLDPAQSTLLAP